MRAAIYARRSTEEHQAASLAVQLEQAHRFCADRGWNVVETHQEDAVSRAEFVKRPALIELLLGAKARRFDAVVLWDETRLGGDLYRTGMVLQELHDAGVEVWYFATGERVRFDDPTAKLMSAVKLYASELERVKIAARTRTHLEARARRGANVGGRVYGYDNVPVMDGERRVRVDYAVNAAEAAVVRRIFELRAAGVGVRGIAKQLNDAATPPPRAGKRGTGSWSPAVVWEILHRERYRGVLVWGREGKAYKGGTRVRVQRPDAEVVRVEVPALCVVPDDLWAAAHATAERARTFSGVAGEAGKARYLLAGLARCSACGGPIHGTNGKQGAAKVKVYVCGYHRARGDAVCRNSHRRLVADVDDAVVGWLRTHVLTEDLVLDVLDVLRRRLAARAATQATEVPAIDGELRTLTGEIERLTRALATSDAPPASVLEAIAEREQRARALRVRREVLLATPAAVAAEFDALAAEARGRLEEVRAVFGRRLEEARAALKALLEGPLVFTPIGEKRGERRFRVEGRVVLSGLLLTVSDPNGSRTLGDLDLGAIELQVAA